MPIRRESRHGDVATVFQSERDIQVVAGFQGICERMSIGCYTTRAFCLLPRTFGSLVNVAIFDSYFRKRINRETDANRN